MLLSVGDLSAPIQSHYLLKVGAKQTYQLQNVGNDHSETKRQRKKSPVEKEMKNCQRRCKLRDTVICYRPTIWNEITKERTKYNIILVVTAKKINNI